MDPLGGSVFNQSNPKSVHNQPTSIVSPSFTPPTHSPHPGLMVTPNHLSTSEWPSSPIAKPHAVGSEPAQPHLHSPIVIWPHRSPSQPQAQFQPPPPQSLYHQPTGHPPLSTASVGRPTSNREPRSPTREDQRRPSIIDPHFSPHDPTSGPPARTGPPSKPKERHTRIRVSGIERNRRDLYIKFDAWSNLTTHRAGHCPNISRAYREFLLFYEAMSANNPHTIVPPVPFPNTSAPNPADDDRLVAAAFQQFFDRLLLDPSLRTDDELRLFLESDFGYTPQTKARRKPGSSSSTFAFGSLAAKTQPHSSRTLPSSTITSQGGPETVVSVVEEDELANARLQFRLVEERLVAAGRSVEHVARAGRALAGAHADLAGKWAGLATTETHASLLAGIRRLGETVRALGAAETAAAVGCLVTLADGLGWCAVEARAGKEVLRNRAGVLEEHYASVKKSIEKRRTIERIKSSASHVGSERVELALDELEEAKKVEDQLAQKAQLISTNLRPALRTHSRHLHDDLLFSLLEHARTQLVYERQVLRDFDRLRPELAAITPKDPAIVYHHTPVVEPVETRAPPVQSPSMINIQPHHARNDSGSVSGRPSRINEMAKSVIVTRGEQDGRQRVDAKSAAASLARLF